MLGLGVSNRPLVRLLLEYGCDVVGCDRTPREKLDAEVLELGAMGCRLHVGDGYLDGVEAAFSALRSNPDQPENFVKLAEELFDRYPAPRNDAERKAYDTLLPMYGRFDEVCRVQPAPARSLASPAPTAKRPPPR